MKSGQSDGSATRSARILDTNEYTNISAIWDVRLSECPGSTPFSGPLVQHAFQQVFCPKSDDRAIGLFNGTALIGLMPIAELPLKIGPFTLRETGFPRNAHTLRNDLLTDANSESCRAILSVFQSEMDADTLLLENLVDQSGLRKILFDSARQVGLLADQPKTGRKIEYADICGSYDAFLATRSGQFRRQLRKRKRFLETEHDVEIVQKHANEIQDSIPDWRRVVEKSWQGRSDPNKVGNSDADWELHRSLIGIGTLWLLYLDGAPVAALRMLEGPRTVYVHTMHFDQDFRNLAPGLILFDAMIKDSASRGISRVDFNGTSKFFSRWATGEIDHFSIRIYRSSLRGKLAQFTRRLIARQTE